MRHTRAQEAKDFMAFIGLSLTDKLVPSATTSPYHRQRRAGPYHLDARSL